MCCAVTPTENTIGREAAREEEWRETKENVTELVIGDSNYMQLKELMAQDRASVGENANLPTGAEYNSSSIRVCSTVLTVTPHSQGVSFQKGWAVHKMA